MEIFRFIYVLPLWRQIILGLLALAVWSILLVYLRQREKMLRRIGSVGFALSLAVISYLTVVTRSSGKGMLITDPLYNFRHAKQIAELYRSLLMNVFLFMPIGMTLPLLFPRRMKSFTVSVLTLLASLIISLCVETAQYYYSLGQAASDDVICNTLGGLAGAVPFIMMRISLGRDKKNEPPLNG